MNVGRNEIFSRCFLDRCLTSQVGALTAQDVEAPAWQAIEPHLPLDCGGLSVQRQTCREAGKLSAPRHQAARALRSSPERGARWDSGKRAWNSDRVDAY